MTAGRTTENDYQKGHIKGSFRSRLANWTALILRGPRFAPRRLFVDARSSWIVAAVFLTLVPVTMILIDDRVSAAVRALPTPLVEIFNEVTDFGKSGWLLFPLGFSLLVLALAPQSQRPIASVSACLAVRVGFLFAAISLPGLFTLVVKQLIGRARPQAALAHALDFHPLVLQAQYMSLPSGHSTTAFAAAAAISALWPRMGWLGWSYAILIGASRVLVNAHYPSDVVASAVIGVVGALAVREYFALRGLAFGVTPDGGIRAFAGPSLRRIRKVACAFRYPERSAANHGN
jgi:undecaprenyl-diphosphatase